MTYPLSSDVVSGQPTAASHYNNLRADALRFGAAAPDAANLGDLLARYESGIKLDILNTDRIRIAASSAQPACLVIDGYPVYAVSNIDLPASGKPSGGVDNWYIFAVRSAGSTIFTLEVNTSPTESTGKRLIGQFYWNGTNIIEGSIRSTLSDFNRTTLFLSNYQVCNGRLTVTSGSPVADGATGTIYFAPFRGNLVSLYAADFGWRTYPFTELNISLAGKLISKCIDVFIYNNAGALALELVDWSTAVTRAVDLAAQDGILVKNGYPEKRYLGTLRTSAAATVSDIATFRGVWNYYNRLRRPFYFTDATVTWTYDTPTWRPWNNNALAKLEFVTGWAEDPVNVVFTGSDSCSGAGIYGSLGLGLDVNNANNAQVSTITGALAVRESLTAQYDTIPTVGYHYLALVEFASAATVTFYGQPAANNTYISGALGHVMG